MYSGINSTVNVYIQLYLVRKCRYMDKSKRNDLLIHPFQKGGDKRPLIQ